MELADECRDCARDSTDPEITRRRYRCINPEWFVPNVRLRLQSFLPKAFTLVTHDVEVNMLFQAISEKIEVYAFVRRLFQEHNSLAKASKSKALFIETAYLFCMDLAESSMSSNFFMYIPKWYYRRCLEDVPILLNCKMCIIIDYHRGLAYRFGIRNSKLTEESECNTESIRTSIVDASVERSIVRYHQRRAAVEYMQEGRPCNISDTIATNRAIHSKRNEPRH